MKKIFILGAYGQNNVGDDALLEVFLRQFADAKVVVNSANPADTRQRYDVEVVDTYLSWPRFRRPRKIVASDLIVFGGGSLLKQIEGNTIAQLLYFVRIFAILLLAKLAGRPTAMLGVGMGPLDRPLFKWLSRWAAELTDLICVRDAASRDLLSAIGVRKAVHVTADPVFTLATTAVATESRNGDKQPAPRDEGRSVRKVVVIPRYSLDAAQQAALAGACDHLIDTYAVEVLFIPFQTGYVAQFDDLQTVAAIRERMRNAAATSIFTSARPSDVLAVIGQADLVVSARLHGLIFAAMQGVPSIALSYEVKVAGFMAELNQSWSCMTLGALEAGQLPAMLDRAWAARGATSAAVRSTMLQLRAHAQQNFELASALLTRPRAGSMLSGGALLFFSMTVVNLGNYLFNLVLGRWLGPAAFADLSLLVTLLLVATLITSTLQTISARFAAIYAVDDDGAKIYELRHWLGRRAWLIGAATFAIFAAGAPFWQSFFQTASAWPFVILGVGLPLYFVQGVDRGILQGQMRFGVLAVSYQAEMWVRLLFAIAFVALGWAVGGAVAGITLSLVATWLVGHWALRARQRPAAANAARFSSGNQRAINRFAGPVLVALIGQVLVNNSDILIVKHFFDAQQAGHYAALALIGRIVFFATASIVAAMFPIVAQKQRRGESHRSLLITALGVVALMSAGIIGLTLLAPNLLVLALFGAQYLPIAPLLWLYAMATTLYALANVVVNYRLAAGGGDSSMPALLAGVMQVVGLWFFHTSLHEVVLVQVYLMAALLGVLIANPRLWTIKPAGPIAAAPSIEPAQRI